jgi:hypothetical protein
MIFESINLLLLESKKKKPKKTKESEGLSTPEDYSSYIKFNRMKKALIRKGIVRVGMPKSFFGPHEKAISDQVLKQQNIEKQQKIALDKQEQEIKIAKLTPAPRATLPTKVDPANPTKRPVAPSLKSSSKDLLPDPTPQQDVMKKIIKLTKGMKNSIKGYTCNSCGFPVPKYRGRYPTNCINCDKPLTKDVMK